MIQFQILSGKQAGFLTEVRRFPFRAGRESTNDLALEEDGVWAEHFQVVANPESGFILTAHPGAKVMINQGSVESARLRNGDIITVGAVKLAFGLGPTRQGGLRLREWLVWLLIAGITVMQLALILWLTRN